MATQVYLGGKGVIINKAGGSGFNIPTFRASYVLFGYIPIATVENYLEVTFYDSATGDTITDNTLDIQDSTGASVGNTVAEVKAYLETIINLGSVKALQEKAATAENQETIITQNTEIESELTDIRTIQEDSQDIIKKELQENNKYLRKIYN